MISNPDSIKSRSMSQRKASVPNTTHNPLTGEEETGGDGNDMQANGAEVAKKMDFDRHRPRSINDKSPLSMMDVVYSMWAGREEEADI